MLAMTVCLLGVSRLVAGFAVSGLYRSSSATFLTPRGRSAVKKVLLPAGTSAGGPIGFRSFHASATRLLQANGATGTEEVAVTTKEELNKLTQMAKPRVQEEQRLKAEVERHEHEKLKFEQQEEQRRQDEARRLREEGVCRDAEALTMKELNGCVEKCRATAIQSATTTADHFFEFETDMHRYFQTKRLEKIREVLTKELPNRLPGVAFDIRCEPQNYDTVRKTYFTHVIITFNWGDDNATDKLEM